MPHARLKHAERRGEECKDDLSDVVREAAVIRGRLGDLAGERAELEQRLAATTLEVPALAAELETARDLMHAAEPISKPRARSPPPRRRAARGR